MIWDSWSVTSLKLIFELLNKVLPHYGHVKPEDPTITFRDFIFSSLIWLFLVFIFGALGIFLLDWPGHRDISKNGVMTMGNVTAKECHRAST